MIDEELVQQAVGSPLYNSKSIPYCITTRSLRFVFVNEAFCEISGYTKEELLNKSVSILLGPRKMAAAFNEFFHFLKHRKNKKLVWQVTGKNGKKLVAKIEGMNLKIGNKNYTLTITLDHTEISESKGLAESSEEKYRRLTENLPHIIWTNDVTGKPVYMNKVALKYFGKSRDDFANWDWLEYFDIEEARELEQEWDIASSLQNPVQKVIRIKNKNGSFKWFQIILFPQNNDQDETTTWTAIATDIDDRVLAEKKLEQTNNRLRSLINASPIPIYSLDTGGRVKDFWNPAAERILGWKKEEVIGKITPLATAKYYKDFEKNLNLIKEQGQFKGTAKREIKNGSEVDIEVHSGCIYNDDQEIEEIIILLLDITQQEAQKIHLEESLAEKKTLLQEIHHRVKNNLSIVVSLLQLQVFQSSNEAEKSKLMDAQNRVMSIAMVHELLYSTDEFSKVDLKAYYDQLIKTIASNMQVQARGVIHELDITLENLNINQAIPLGLLINELITNSLKYAFPTISKESRIKLAIHPDGENIIVYYMDNGVGFDTNEESFKSGLGFQIIKSLLSQLEAKYEMDTTDGFKLNLCFENHLKSKKSEQFT